MDNKHVIAQEEIFGPVLSVIPADSEDNAVDIANDSAAARLNPWWSTTARKNFSCLMSTVGPPA